MRILEIVKDLNPMLTDIDHNKRQSGLEKLVKEVTSSSPQSLVTKEIETLMEFLSLRLTDHKSMVEPSLKCFSYFIDCPSKPTNYDHDLLEFLKSKINIQRMDPKCRYIVYDMLEKILKERKMTVSTMDSGLMYSIIHLIEDESYPQNILRCFKLISHILKNFEDLEPFLDDIFEWVGRYFPIDYTPKEDADPNSNIQRSDLVDAIHECFYCKPDYGNPVLSLLVETYESNSLAAKVEALECLIKCFDMFSLQILKDYTSTVWTSIRTQCLKRVSLLDPTMLELSYKLMSSMTKRLSEDDWLFKTFISDIYEELAIAFRKPEIDLFEAAARLVVHAAQPKMTGFNYIIDKILPVSIATISANDRRPLPGLTYLFDKLNENHPNSSLDTDLNSLVDKLLKLLVNLLDEDQEVMRLILAVTRCNIIFEESTLDTLVDKLFGVIGNHPDLAEDCLLNIYAKGRTSIIFENNQSAAQQDLTFTIKSIVSFEGRIDSTSTTRYNLYLRHLISTFNSMERKSLDSLGETVLKSLLISTRRLALNYLDDGRILQKTGHLSAIIINKLDTSLVQPLMMDLFTSDYCQKLVPSDQNHEKVSKQVYLPIVRWFFAGLVIRNHTLYEPLINLILNCISNDEADDELCMECAKCFKFAQSAEEVFQFDKKHHHQIFPFYKQKLFNQLVKEIKIRCEGDLKESRRRFLTYSIALQLPHLRTQIYSNQIDWLVREILKLLNNLKASAGVSKSVSILLNCLEDAINKDLDSNLSGLCKSMVDMCLFYAKSEVDLETRRVALRCLLKISVCMKESDLLLLRQSVVKELKPCLSDKKRLVRQFAGEARLRWTLIGQPIG